QFTCLAIWAAFVLAAWRTFEYLRVIPTFEFARVVHGSLPGILNLAVSGILLVVGLWLGFRIVNLASFADFLIAVEAEMNKVSWPSRTELIRASMVVIVLMFGLTIVLFTYDITLTWFLHAIGVVYAAPPPPVGQ